MSDYSRFIAAQLKVRPEQISTTIQLLDADNTIPFIARYRKEATGGLDEEQLRQTSDLLGKLRALDERRQTVLNSIEEQGKLTPELQQQIQAAVTMTELEDLYQPYKPKRRTRASMARERGLQPLADKILSQELGAQSLDDLAAAYLSDEVPTVDDAWAGARDIVAETVSDHPQVRQTTRQKALQWGLLQCEKVEGAEDVRRVYEIYYSGEFRVDRMRSHQVLAINRGETDKVLKVRVQVAERDWQNAVYAVYRKDTRSVFAEQLEMAVSDAAERLLLPAIERDVRRELTEKAEGHAILVFAENLRALLSQPPLSGFTVMGIDPGFRTGCKIAIVDPTGKLLDTATIYPHQPQNQWAQTLEKLAILVKKYAVQLLAIGNGTASRETEQLAAELISSIKGLHYLMVSEAGASVYSASPLARAEMPQLDVSLRGAVSIARRVQDPLAELVKIDPKSIGVGMYQHDVDQKQLTAALNAVVESVVNAVGVDVNTASPALLTYVAGIGPKLAERMVAYREERGVFTSRQEFTRVSGLGPKAFEQAAGFLRIRNGSNPLDASAIHPESYKAAEKVLKMAGSGVHTQPEERKDALDALLQQKSLEQIAAEIQIGIPTLRDILVQLVRPGRDPRQDLPTPVLRSDVLKMEDLVVGMCLKGTVRNVVDFGAFVDIGVKQDGLLHRSQVPVSSTLKVGDIIQVEIQKVEADRGRISLAWVKN
ncbi:MAG TPA: Tex family protein [Anaerolineales bacterium]|nr:Tex family protein [Anaerolineales bacterium]